MSRRRLTAVVAARSAAARFAVLTCLVAGFGAGAASISGSTATSHRAAGVALRNLRFPSWSPDGKQILVGAGNRIVRRSGRSGGPIRTVYAAPRGHVPLPLFWAPGGRVVFGDDYNGSIPWYSVGLQGGKPKRITLGRYPQKFILTPKRAYAAVAIEDVHGPASITLLKLKRGRHPIVISTPLAAEERSGAVSDHIWSFSPHGKQLIFSRSRYSGTGPSGPMAFRLGSGRAPVPLAQSGLRGASLVQEGAPQWSPDGRWVAFVQNQSLEVVPTSGATAPRVLPPCPDPASHWLESFSWSPSSTLILYNCYGQILDGADLMTVRPDGTHPTDPLAGRPLTYVNSWGGLGEPAQWSPDGSRLLFLAHAGPPVPGDSHPTVHVWTVRPNGHNLTQLG